MKTNRFGIKSGMGNGKVCVSGMDIICNCLALQLFLLIQAVPIVTLAFSMPLDTVRQNDSPNAAAKVIDAPAKVKEQPGADRVNPPKANKKEPCVKSVVRYGNSEKKEEDRNFAGIGDLIEVKVEHLKELTNRSKCLDNDENPIESNKCSPKKIMLYLDGRQVEGINPESGAPSPSEQILRFRLERAVGVNDKIWADLLGAPPIGLLFFNKPTKVSVGLEGEFPIPIEPTCNKFNLIRIRKAWFWVGTVLMGFLLFYTFRLARKSDILRDSGPIVTDAVGNEVPKPYSLARCQMAFWFFWVICSFIYLWLITGAYDIITSEALILIGIGSATALGATSIDSGKSEEVASKQKSLEMEKLKLTEEITALDTNLNTVPPPPNIQVLTQQRIAGQVRLSLVDNQLADLNVVSRPRSSAGWLSDILRDNTGVSFHRFQILVWTMVLGILFVFSVWKRLSMPEFGATLLALQGLSAATYIGFKIPEKRA
ncbi:hypothetical protein [Dyadobacter sandarakinus]|uniref:Uncharacterized protein n=1 Tax=Dyadobacter sandarakinus TaxID=2747268 RepID=A0ABX7I5N5_9BACT|nr:hypothetical protein [Dyadobacter sandarakinus]QRR01406.1 hypothetical protein HWI92_11075 [Dyadobacter sandarakinus]